MPVRVTEIIASEANAKINLCLHVTGKRADGYHLLDSLVVFAGVHDTVSARPSADLSLRITGPFAGTLTSDADNLVLRAARSLAAAAGVPAHAALSLEKRLPVASGIGGGSADAAAALRVLCRLWAVDLPERDLFALAASLGADVPVCLAAMPARMRGIGDRLQPAPALPEYGLVLVNPGIAVSTADVFRARPAGVSPDLTALPGGWATAGDLALALSNLTNDLEAPAIALCPQIGTLLRDLRETPGVLLARMSGSGATCFALTATPQAATTIASGLNAPGRWCWGGKPRPFTPATTTLYDEAQWGVAKR